MIVSQGNLLNYVSDIVDEVQAFEQFIDDDSFIQMCYVKFKSNKEYIHLYNKLEETDYTIFSLKKFKSFWVVVLGYDIFPYDDFPPKKKTVKKKTKKIANKKVK